MILGVLEAGGCHVEQIPRNRQVLLGHMRQTDPLYQPHRGVDDRLSGKAMDAAMLETEHIADEMKCANLSPPVGKQLVTAHRSVDDLIDVFRGLGLPENLGAAAIFEFLLKMRSFCDRLPSSPRKRGLLAGPPLRLTNIRHLPV